MFPRWTARALLLHFEWLLLRFYRLVRHVEFSCIKR